MKPRVRIVGSLNIDYTTITNRFPGPGETVVGNSLSISAGGKGANQAVACGRAAHVDPYRQNVNVDFISSVGADDSRLGTLIKPVLAEAKIDGDEIIEVDGSQTGTATIIVDAGHGGENRIVIVPGANHDGMKNKDTVLERAFRDPLPDIMVLQGEIPPDTTFALLDAVPQHAKQARRPIQVVFNPAPVFAGGIPTNFLQQVGHLIVNETEMAQLVNDAGEKYAAAASEEEKRTALLQATQVIHGWSIPTVIITRGAQGIFGSTQEKSFTLPAAPVVPEVVDTTAAGDTFVGYYAVELARGLLGDAADAGNVEQACSRAISASARCVAKAGGMASIPWGYEVET